MKECINCIFADKCTPFEQQQLNEDGNCSLFVTLDLYACSDGSTNWKEFSWNKYTDNILNYGEEEETELDEEEDFE
jgi:hypothetical protein